MLRQDVTSNFPTEKPRRSRCRPPSESSPENLKFEREDWSLFRTTAGLQQRAGVTKEKLARCGGAALNGPRDYHQKRHEAYHRAHPYSPRRTSCRRAEGTNLMRSFVDNVWRLAMENIVVMGDR
jgi:hypothetical protein